MDPLYRPQGVESRWQETWEAEGLYSAEASDPRETFVICLPPPNVTGELHMGHALNASCQDVLIRWHRMRDFNALWQPGYDHASIALQRVMVRRLAAEGIDYKQLGREEFERRCWQFIDQYGDHIVGQLRSLGASLDYRRMRFTMDDAYTHAVMCFFVHLWNAGRIYRANRIVNWCTGCASTVSDLEVDHIDVDDTLSFVRYPLADGSGHVTIATVRPATILADVAVAVNPNDERYRGLVGKEVIVPVAERRVPIIADERVETDFGSGALKITPGHDTVDWEIGRDHDLPEPMVIGLDGRMNAEAGPDYEGLTQQEAGEKILAELKERGLLEKQEPYRHAVGHCNRSGDRIEPLVLLQWWVEMKELAAPGDRRAARRPRAHEAGAADERDALLPREHPALVHLAAALVGPPDPGLVLPRRAHDGVRDGAVCLRRVRQRRAATGRGRARHVVLVRALAFRDPRLARADAPISSASTRATSARPGGTSTSSGFRG